MRYVCVRHGRRLEGEGAFSYSDTIIFAVCTSSAGVFLNTDKMNEFSVHQA